MNFIYLASLGYIDVNDIIQIFNPSGGDIKLDPDSTPQSLAVRFGAEVYDHAGQVNTRVVLIKDRTEIEFLIAALGLLRAPSTLEEVNRRFQMAMDRLRPADNMIAQSEYLNLMVDDPNIPPSPPIPANPMQPIRTMGLDPRNPRRHPPGTVTGSGTPNED